jgi:hypothetical protein
MTAVATHLVMFEKRDLSRITDRFSMHQLELFLRRVANQEAFAIPYGHKAISLPIA